MSLNMYFKKEIRQAEGFKGQPYPDGSGDKMNIMGMNLFSAGDLLYSIQDENGVVPTELEKYVVNISMYARISAQRATREMGIYRHESAEAEVELELGNKNPEYQIKINGKKMEDIHALLRMIKSGSIRPTESYERAQDGKSCKELEDEFLLTKLQLSDARTLIANLQESSEISGKFFGDRIEELGRQRDQLHGIRELALNLELGNERDLSAHLIPYWPFCSKKGIAKRIKAILYGK